MCVSMATSVIWWLTAFVHAGESGEGLGDEGTSQNLGARRRPVWVGIGELWELWHGIVTAEIKLLGNNGIWYLFQKKKKKVGRKAISETGRYPKETQMGCHCLGSLWKQSLRQGLAWRGFIWEVIPGYRSEELVEKPAVPVCSNPLF